MKKIMLLGGSGALGSYLTPMLLDTLLMTSTVR